MRIARAGGSHRILTEQSLGPRPGLGGHIIAHQLEGIKNGTVLLDDLVKRLVPPERVGTDNRGLVAMHQRQQLDQSDAREHFVERG